MPFLGNMTLDFVIVCGKHVQLCLEVLIQFVAFCAELYWLN